MLSMTGKQKVCVWKNKWNVTSTIAPASEKNSLQATLKQCKSFFPNIFNILSLLATLPVGTCSSEWFFSALRHLKTWSKSTMMSEYLIGMAMMYVHMEMELVRLDILKNLDSQGQNGISLAFDKHDNRHDETTQ